MQLHSARSSAQNSHSAALTIREVDRTGLARVELPWCVVEILLVRLRVAKSLKNFTLQCMNQRKISLITRSVERS